MVLLPLGLEAFPWTEAVVLAMAFAWGASLGSFVNVVAHRVPRGESLVHGPSRCPACGTAIRPRDNIPVVGWLLLKGRCRECGSPIAPRYLAVELLCGGIAALVAAAELGGGSLPWLSPPGGQPLDRMLMLRDLRPLAAWALHAGLLILLVAWALLGGSTRGGRSAPWVALGVVVAAVVAMPAIGPPGIAPRAGRWPADPRVESLVAAGAGAAAGWLIARLTAPALDAGSLTVLGAAVGWQAVTVVAIVTAMAAAIGRMPIRWPCPAFAPLPAVATVAIVWWRPIRAACMLAWPWPGGH